MRNSTKVIFLNLVLVSICNVALGQVNISECKNLLTNYVKSMTEISKPEGSSVYRLKYSIETFNKPGSFDKNMAMTADMVLSKNKSSMVSNYMTMYADQKNGFLILPQQRQIIWGPGGSAGYDENNFKMISAMQDSIIRLSKIGECSDHTINDEKYKQIVLIVPNSIIQKFMVSKIALYYNTNKNYVSKVILYHTEKSNLDKTIVNYEDIDYNYKEKTNWSAYSKVLTSDGKLRPEYKGFQLIDNRSKN